jgi:hypothetical protein
MTKPLNIQNKAAYTKIIESSGNNDEFEIFIRKSINDKFNIVVKKEMALGELKKNKRASRNKLFSI